MESRIELVLTPIRGMGTITLMSVYSELVSKELVATGLRPSEVILILPCVYIIQCSVERKLHLIW